MRNIYATAMPPQKISMSRKNDEWRRQCVEAIINMSGQLGRNGRTSKQNKQINYDLYNSKFDESDFTYVLDPYGLAEKWGEAPARLQAYNIIRSKIELLKGEEIRRGFNFRAVGVHGNVVTEKQQKKRELILAMLQNMIAMQGGMEVAEDGTPQTPEQLQKYINTTLMDPREVTANQLLDYFYHKERLELKFNMGWEHALIAGEEIYYVGIVNGEPSVRVVNPLNFDYDADDETKFLEDAQWTKEERFMSIGNVLDAYGDKLTDSQIDMIERNSFAWGRNQYGMQPGFAYTPESFMANSRAVGPVGSVHVAHVTWKSMLKLGFLSYPDPKTGEMIDEVVSEDFKMPQHLAEAGATLEWKWVNEAWEGTRIGNGESAIFIGIQPLLNQQRSVNNPSECKLPYTGYIYNNTNSQATSMVDLIKPHQYTYMVTWYRLENELAKAKGKKFIFDIAMLPKSQGWTMEQWMYYIDVS